jgi:hypothetical protein
MTDRARIRAGTTVSGEDGYYAQCATGRPTGSIGGDTPNPKGTMSRVGATGGARRGEGGRVGASVADFVKP